MTRAEIIALRDDALTVIAEIYQIKPGRSIDLRGTMFNLKRAIAMHEAACQQLYTLEGFGLSEITEEDEVQEWEYLRKIEQAAIDVVKVWRANQPRNQMSAALLDKAICDLAEKFPLEGGA